MKTALTYKQQWKLKGILFVLPSFVILCVFIFLPVILNFRYCFTDYNGINSDYHFIGFKNFQDIIQNDKFFLILKNTFVLSLIYVVGLNILAIIFATFITRIGRKFGNFVKSLLFFPCLLSMVVTGFIWKLIYNYNSGLVNSLLTFLGLGSVVQDWLGDKNLVLLSVSISIIWFALGYYLIIYYAGLMSIPQEMYEAAGVEGASAVKQFRYVTLPMLTPSITINVVLSTMGILSCFDLPYVLTSGGGPGFFGTTIAIEIYRYAYSMIQTGKSFALSVILALICIVIAVIELKLLIKKEEKVY